MTLVILAAGLGSRYGGMKQLDPMGPCGELIIDYSVYDAIHAGVKKIVFIIKEENKEKFEAGIVDRIRKSKHGGNVVISYAFQRMEDSPASAEIISNRKKPWGTLHALLSARAEVDGDFIVINADDFYGRQAFETVTEFLRNTETVCCMPGYVLEKTLSDNGEVSRGICERDAESFLTGIRELKNIERSNGLVVNTTSSGQEQLSPQDLVSMNFWGFRKETFPFFAGCFRDFLTSCPDLLSAERCIGEAVMTLLEQGAIKVKILDNSFEWFGVTNRADKPYVIDRIKELTESGHYPYNLWAEKMPVHI